MLLVFGSSQQVVVDDASLVHVVVLVDPGQFASTLPLVVVPTRGILVVALAHHCYSPLRRTVDLRRIYLLVRVRHPTTLDLHQLQMLLRRRIVSSWRVLA